MPARRRNAAPPRTGGCGTIKVASWNVRSARKTALQAIGRALESLEVDFAVLQETKLTGKYSRRLAHSGYKVQATKAFSASKGGVALVWRERDYFVHLGWPADHTSATRIYDPRTLFIKIQFIFAKRASLVS